MTPKEKAIDLYNKFRNEDSVMAANVRAKRKSIICVDEIINANGLHPNDTDYDYNKAEEYWQSVKQELLKM